MHQLYGDGIHDDTAAIQELIDSGVCEVSLPAPKKHYLISKPLELPSNFRLVLPRFAVIRLADNANCVMVRNKMVKDHAKRLPEFVYHAAPHHPHIWGYVDDYSPDAPCQNIELCGGIWDCNNMNQIPNPEQARDFSVREFYGYGIFFYNVKNLKISALTVKDPTMYAITLDTVTYFTVEDITFDFNMGNPIPLNMDGVHIDGNCHYGMIRNLKGACYDDLVAINAHEGTHGPITNIEIDGLYAENCHSAVRLLTVSELIESIHISNIYGTYYQYVVGITKFYEGETTGHFDSITVDNVYASKSIGVYHKEKPYPRTPESALPYIYIQSDTDVRTLTVRSLHRREKKVPKETVYIGKTCVIDRLILDDVTTQNDTGKPMPLLYNKGTIKHLSLKDVDAGNDEVIVNEGTIENRS